MNNKQPGRKYQRPKLPRSVVIMYIIMAVILLAICVLVFIIMYNNVKEDAPAGTSSSASLVSSESTSSTSSTSSSSSTRSSSSSSSSKDNSDSSDESKNESSDESSAESSDESAPDTSSDSMSHPAPSEDYTAGLFDDDLFIGDSIFTGLYLYGKISEDNVAAAIGFTPYGAMNTAIEGKGVTAVQYAKSMQPKRIIIMLGSNAMGAASDYSGLEGSYRELVTILEKNCPNARICCVSITPVTADSGEAARWGITNENIRSVNEYIENMCAELGHDYCDLYGLVSTDSGYFSYDYAEADGIHFLGRTYNVLLSALEKIFS